MLITTATVSSAEVATLPETVPTTCATVAMLAIVAPEPETVMKPALPVVVVWRATVRFTAFPEPATALTAALPIPPTVPS